MVDAPRLPLPPGGPIRTIYVDGHNHTYNNHLHISAMDGASVHAVLHDNLDAVGSAMGKAARGGHFKVR